MLPQKINSTPGTNFKDLYNDFEKADKVIFFFFVFSQETKYKTLQQYRILITDAINSLQIQQIICV